MPKPIPEFKNEDEERQFWAEHDSTEYIDWDQVERAGFTKLNPFVKPSTGVSPIVTNAETGRQVMSIE